MTWNLWNVVRHYVYIKYFKNKHRSLGNDDAAWTELEKYTKKIVKGIYRTFQQNKKKTNGVDRSTFYSMDGTSTNYGGQCQVHWTNSFIEVSTILERNAREHNASFVLFTGDIPRPNFDKIRQEKNAISRDYDGYSADDRLASARYSYREILNSHDSFRVTTNEGVDADDTEDGMRPRSGSSNPY